MQWHTTKSGQNYVLYACVILGSFVTVLPTCRAFSGNTQLSCMPPCHILHRAHMCVQMELLRAALPSNLWVLLQTNECAIQWTIIVMKTLLLVHLEGYLKQS